MFNHLQQHGNNMGANLEQQQQQFGGQMMNANAFSEGMSSQSMVEQNVQGIMDHLSMLQERITQLQALVPLISQTAHCQTDSNVVAQQQAASAAVVSIISQLAMAAIGLLPQQQPFSNPTQTNQSTELPLSQLLQAAVSPAANFFQQSNALGNDPLRASQRTNNNNSNSLGNLMASNIFSTSGAPVPGVNASVGGSNCGLRSFSGGHAFPGLNNEGDLSGQQNLSGQQQQAAGSSPSGGAMSLQHQMTNNGVGGGGSKGRGGVNAAANMLNNSGLAPGSSANNFISHDLGGMSTGDSRRAHVH